MSERRTKLSAVEASGSKDKRRELLSEVSLLAEEESGRCGLKISPKTILCLTEVVEAMAVQRVAPDLEAFAIHAKKTTVSVDDVKLVARRNEDLVLNTH